MKAINIGGLEIRFGINPIVLNNKKVSNYCCITLAKMIDTLHVLQMEKIHSWLRQFFSIPRKPYICILCCMHEMHIT